MITYIAGVAQMLGELHNRFSRESLECVGPVVVP